MDSNLTNKVSQIIEIEDDVIDLDDAEKTPEEVIYEWDAKIRKKLLSFAVTDCDVLCDLMKEYLQSLQEMARSFEDNEFLKNKVNCHISFLHSYFVELQCCSPETYLNNMEDILTLYCNLELEVLCSAKRKDCTKRENKRKKLTCKRIIYMLTLYLLERRDHILHVLIKMNTNVSDSCSEVLNVIYTHFLTKVPAFDLCDESFCRSYIVFQKWKEIRKVEEWEGMDKIMYKMFNRTPESIKNNETLRKILMPPCQSTVGFVLNLFRSFCDISKAYFKHIAEKNNTEMDDLNFNIDLDDDEPAISLKDEDEEEVVFLKACYEFERNISNLTLHNNESTDVDLFRKCKEEVEEEEDITLEPIINDTFIFTTDDENFMNLNYNFQIDEDRTSSLLSSTKEKNPDVENLNGISKICTLPASATETSTSCSLIDSQEITVSSDPIIISTTEEDVLENNLFEIATVSGNILETEIEINEPEVSFQSTTTQPLSPNTSTVECDVSEVEKRTTQTKSVEVQVDIDDSSNKNHVYNDYGLTTPPFDVPTEEQNSRSVQAHIYVGHSKNIEKEKNVVETKTVEVQAEPPNNKSYEYYGLTPPNDTPIDDHNSRLEETCIYTNIGHNHKEKIQFNVPESVDVTHKEITSNTSEVSKPVSSNNTYPEDENFGQLEIPVDSDTEEIDIESCHDALAPQEINQTCQVTSEVGSLIKHPSVSFHLNEDIDTGQVTVLTEDPEEQKKESNHPSTPTISVVEIGDLLVNNAKAAEKSTTSHNGDQNIETSAETKDSPHNSETFNGNTVLKPLLSSNRTNGQTNPAKIIYTSSQKIKASLDDFSKFEKAMQVQWSKMKENQDFEEILSGPVSKITPTKHNSLLTSKDQLEMFEGQDSNPRSSASGNSRSNSPAEMTSPPYEDMEDFKRYFGDSLNGRVPPPHDVRVPQGILKKTNTTKRKNQSITFHDSTYDNSEERRPRSDGVMVPKRIRRDRKLNMEPKVVLERLTFIENKMKKVLNNPPTLRVDYDKTTRHINERDVVRCISPPRFSWMIKPDVSRSRQSAGKVKYKSVDEYCKKVSLKCERNQSECCHQLAEEFNRLNCSVEDDALNSFVADDPKLVDPESEFSNSPTFLQDSDKLVERCLREASVEEGSVEVGRSSLLCDNSNFYKSQACVASTDSLSDVDGSLGKRLDDSLLKLPTAVPETYDFEKNLKNEVFSKIDLQNLEREDSDCETKLPLKKRKLSVKSEEAKKEEISYPATPMISIAEVEALHPRKLQANNGRAFKTPAERKEMPPLPVFYNVDSEPSPIITDQFNINNHTYNNPTINYHMNNVPLPFINMPCGSYYSLPPILVPFNNISQQQEQSYVKKEGRKQGRQRRRH